ncbi:MAG: hypothetical protein K0B87_06305 [Candidatus Syntrophosphaera sp.]|nr:hypothetical protein [Candidatus Syntrophosphaera sp.]
MKRAIIILALLAFGASVYAHPAADLEATYSVQNKTLNISFTHSVKDPADHFIQGVEVRLNDVMIISQVCSAQDTATGGSFVYRIPNLKKNDTIRVTLICNKTGKKSATMVLK